MATNSIYNDRFAYNIAKAETGCDSVIPKTACPALTVERRSLRDGVPHPLFALSACLQCRRQLGQQK
ncbi:MAG: hypothetical protein J6T57_04525 [Alphaproteobacteria bacterium]|nr:hypothetical protein [Alphaproteobacteria bacterium]